MLSERFRQHRSDVIHKRTQTSPVAEHFISAGHGVEHMTVAILAGCKTKGQRKALEMKLIHKLGTLHPKGINIDFSFNV